MTCTNLYTRFLNASLHELADLVVKGEGKERRLQLVDNFATVSAVCLSHSESSEPRPVGLNSPLNLIGRSNNS
jgi:hypothetical protein